MPLDHTIRMGYKRITVLFPMCSVVPAVVIFAAKILLVDVTERTPPWGVVIGTAPVTVPSEHQCLDSTFVLLNKSMPQCKHL